MGWIDITDGNQKIATACISTQRFYSSIDE
jgi:hypothetical protein